MMSFPDECLTALLDLIVSEGEPTFRLYRNQVVVNRATTIADLVELDGPGYFPQLVTSWLPAVMDDDQAVTEADPIQWIREAPGISRMVYGYYVTFGGSSQMLWIQPVSGEPLRWQQAGDTIRVVPRLELKSTCQGVNDVTGIGEGVGTILINPVSGEGDGVGDFESSVIEPSLMGEGDGVGDFESSVIEPSLMGEGDGIGDMEGTAFVTSRSGGGEGIGDSESTVEV